MVCSPMVRKSGKMVSGSCYTPNILEQIRKEYNSGHDTANQITTTNPEEIWKELHTRLSHCDKEDCWLAELKDEQMRKRIERYIFAPDKPYEWKKNPTAWLSNYDILNVLEQYEEAHPEFEFIGPTPIDFDTRLTTYGNQCVTQELCAFSLADHQKKRKTKIGIVFNLDKHNEPGSHWVSMFIDMEHNLVFYFDSAGDEIPEEIKALKERVVRQAAEMGHTLESVERTRVHQHGNTECGVYSLFFLITMLTGEYSPKPGATRALTMPQRVRLFKSQRIPDKAMEKYRGVYFND